MKIQGATATTASAAVAEAEDVECVEDSAPLDQSYIAQATQPTYAKPGAYTAGLNGTTGPLEPVLEWTATNKTQKGSWWPMFSWGLPNAGNTQHNHWAKNGPLEKLDKLTGASSQQLQKETRHRSWNQLSDQLRGKGDRWDTLNAGHCNQEAMRCAWFEEPTRTVVKDGVTFKPSDIKGLMVLCMDDLSTGFEYCGWRYSENGELPPQRDPNDPPPHQVIETVVKDWGMTRKLAIIADRKTHQELDNRLYDGGKLEHLAKPPKGLRAHDIPPGGTVKYYRLTMTSSASPEHVIRCDAWLHTADDGTVTSKWITGKAQPLRGALGMSPRGLTPNPDFYWIAKPFDDVAKGAPWIGYANKTNSEVDMFEVWKLYTESIGKDWRAIAAQYPDLVAAHEDIKSKKRAPSAPPNQ